MDIVRQKNGTPILTSSYQLDLQLNSSTVRRFIQHYSEHIKTLRRVENSSIYGFWLGVINVNHKPELVKLELHGDKISSFTRFINGQNYTNETTFLPEQVKQENGSAFISTSHQTFANQLIFHSLSSNMLTGYMYSIHQEQPLQTGDITLFRIGQ
jgi:hypothetical protein